MSFLDIILFLFICYGIANIIMYADIFDPVRNKILSFKIKKINTLLSCPMCIGFWCGLIVHFFGISLVNFFCDAIIGSIGCHIMSMLEDKFFPVD